MISNKSKIEQDTKNGLKLFPKWSQIDLKIISKLFQKSPKVVKNLLGHPV